MLTYVQFSAAQYIDTLLTPNNNWTIDSKWTRDAATAMYYYGASSSSNTASCTAYLSTSSGNWRWKNRYASITVSTGEHTSSQSKTGVVFDGTNKAYNGSVSSFTAPVSLTIGCNHAADGSYGTTQFNGKVYYFKIYNSGTLIMGLQPARENATNTIGFLDSVSGDFFASESGTDFTGA